MFSKFLIATIAVVLMTSLVSAEVIEINSENFESVVMDPTKNVFAAVTATWCGHCVRMKPAFAELSNSDLPADTVVVNIDADKNQAATSKLGVRGFPTVKFFPKGNKAGIDYKGARDVKSFQDFIKANI